LIKKAREPSGRCSNVELFRVEINSLVEGRISFRQFRRHTHDVAVDGAASEILARDRGVEMVVTSQLGGGHQGRNSL